MTSYSAVEPIRLVGQELSGLDLLIHNAKKAIKEELKKGSHLCVGFSGGKDSSVTLAITLEAAKEWSEEGGVVPTIHCLQVDTRMENPVVHAYNKTQLKRIRDYSTDQVPIKVWVAEPSLSQDYLVSLIGGRTIASVGNSTKCQQMTKSSPLGKVKAHVKKFISGQTGEKRKNIRVVSVIGTRFDESVARGAAMAKRGESASEAKELATASKELVLSPIANFSVMDVFKFIGRVTSGRMKTYDSWDDLLAIYRDANQGDCMVVSFVAGTEAPRAPCSARTGCWTCLRVSRDVTAENMLADEQKRFDWMRVLTEIREYIQKRHFDPSARCWLGRTIDEERGTIKIQPNSYSPAFTYELLGIMLTAQRDEERIARRLGIEPRFTLLTLQQIIAIDCLWARYGYQKPFSAVRLYRDIEERGHSVRIPDTSDLPVFTAEDVKFSAEAPFCDRDYNAMFSGLRDVNAAAAGCEEVKVMRNGTMLLQATNEGDCFDIDEEGAWMFYGLDLDYALKRVTLDDAPADAFFYLLGLGTIQFYKGGHSEWDRMLRMSQQIHRSQLQPILHDPQALLERLGGTMLKKPDEVQLGLF